jgi:hypothetical protein
MEHARQEAGREWSWTVEARNTAPDSDNKIHDDEVARQFGFAGGLVPGVTTYAWLARQALVALGPRWLERGTIEARFLSPVYEGQQILVEASVGDAGDGGPVTTITAYGPGGEQAAVATARIPEHPEAPPDAASYPPADLPHPAAAVSAEVLRGLGPLGVLEAGFRADRAGEYLDSVGDDHPYWTQAGVAHPGWLLLFANWILAANVHLGPWIHTGSTVIHYRPLSDGERFQLRGRVVDVYERRGHQLVDLDLVYVVGPEVVQRVKHTAIYRIRPA